MSSQLKREGSKKGGCLGKGCLIFFLFFVGCTSYCFIDIARGPRIFEHLSYEECDRGYYCSVPEGASDICYRVPVCLSVIAIAYEFSIDEETFVDWATRMKWDLREIAQETLSIDRYNGEWTEICNGLVSERTFSSNGSGETVAFDRDQGRAYRIVTNR